MWPWPDRAVRAATLIRSRRSVAPRALAQARLARAPAARSRLQAMAAQASHAALAANELDVIFSLPIFQPSELQFCVVDSVVHGTCCGFPDSWSGSFCCPFPGRVAADERIAAARCSPSARSSASRSCRFSDSRTRMRAVAASRRRSSEACVACCRSGTSGDAWARCCLVRSRSIWPRRSSWAYSQERETLAAAATVLKVTGCPLASRLRSADMALPRAPSARRRAAAMM